MQFQFNSSRVKSLRDCTDSRLLNRQFLANYYVGQGIPQSSCIVAIDPWRTCRITFEGRQSENRNLDMNGLTDAYSKFGEYCNPSKLLVTRHPLPKDGVLVPGMWPKVTFNEGCRSSHERY
jgi:hypothetical protein